MPNFRKGFTLIELLVVISIIGILATLVTANLNAARSRARDAQRKSDVRNLATALRLYFNDNGNYPASDNNGNILVCDPTGNHTCIWGGPWISNGITYMSSLPKDPLPGQSYNYTVVGSDSYIVKGCLENISDSSAVPAGGNWCPTGEAFVLQP